MTCLKCPASMCPLIAKDGSPWTGRYDSPCPGHDDIDTDGCAWWSMACSTNGIQEEVETAAETGGKACIVGPNQPRRNTIGTLRAFDCPKVAECRWQERAQVMGLQLCPPRDALSRGLDPRVCLF